MSWPQTGLRRVGVAGMTLGLALSGCGSATQGGRAATLTVSAASSLTDAFTLLAAGFERLHAGTRVQLNFGGTPSLVSQVEAGAPVDVLAAADTASPARLDQEHLVVGAVAVFASNRLAIAVAPGNPRHLRGLGDLSRTDLKIVLCDPSVPAGKYADQAIALAGVSVHPASREADVRAALGRVELGEADAAIVYLTDVAAAGGRVTVIQIPDAQNVLAHDAIAVLKASREPTLAALFRSYVLSPAGQAVLRTMGFLSPGA
ncbi:MAG: molybdate ABC transporter substrate-binding protein [Candidatus Dormibacteria bacterium]